MTLLRVGLELVIWIEHVGALPLSAPRLELSVGSKFSTAVQCTAVPVAVLEAWIPHDHEKYTMPEVKFEHLLGPNISQFQICLVVL